MDKDSPSIPDAQVYRLTSPSTLARNTVRNFIGQAAPILAAFFAIPLLIKGLGTERFGVLTLSWVVVGYGSLFDLGLGRALTQLVAKKLGMGQDQEASPLVWTSLFLMLILGLVGALVLILLSPVLVYTALRIPEALQLESLRTFYLVAVSIPVVISTASLRGILEVQQRFDLINRVRIPIGLFTYLGPLLVLPFSSSLIPVVGVLLVSRLLAWLAHLLLCFHVMPTLRHDISLQLAAAGPLLRFGGWMTVTNVVGPLLTSLDRFLIGGLISAAAVAYYTTPYEAVTKVWIVPGAAAGVLFPAFATSFVHDQERTALLFARGVKYVFLSLFPVTLVVITLAHEGLSLWLGVEFAQHSTRVLQWLALGVFLNSLGFIPFALVQGVGRPELTATLHLVELPVYLAVVWWLTKTYGIEGAAIAWVVRVAVDMAILFIIAGRLLPDTALSLRRVVAAMPLGLVLLAPAFFATGIAVKAAFLLLTLLAVIPIAWFLILSPNEREIVRNRVKMLHLWTA